MRGLPHHGVGRSCKVGKEEIFALMVALERFAGADAAVRRAGWRAALQAIIDAARLPVGRAVAIVDDVVPLLAITDPDPAGLQARLATGSPAIHVRLVAGRLLVSPIALAADGAANIAAALSV